MQNLVQIGWFAVGTGKFGVIEFGREFEPLDGNLEYWKGRGYFCVPVFAPEPIVEKCAAEEWTLAELAAEECIQG